MQASLRGDFLRLAILSVCLHSVLVDGFYILVVFLGGLFEVFEFRLGVNYFAVEFAEFYFDLAE